MHETLDSQPSEVAFRSQANSSKDSCPSFFVFFGKAKESHEKKVLEPSNSSEKGENTEDGQGISRKAKSKEIPTKKRRKIMTGSLRES